MSSCFQGIPTTLTSRGDPDVIIQKYRWPFGRTYEGAIPLKFITEEIEYTTKSGEVKTKKVTSSTGGDDQISHQRYADSVFADILMNIFKAAMVILIAISLLGIGMVIQSRYKIIQQK
jgi:hypothetical protein